MILGRRQDPRHAVKVNFALAPAVGEVFTLPMASANSFLKATSAAPVRESASEGLTMRKMCLVWERIAD